MIQRLQREVRALLFEEDSADGADSSRLRHFLRFWVTVGRGFAKNRCPVRASALAYSSLLAFIPLLAVVVGIVTGVLKTDPSRIQVWIDDLLANLVPQLMGTEEFAGMKNTVVDYTLKMIGNVHSGALGTTGMVALIVMIIFMLVRIEETLNDIWGILRGRAWYARLVNYWAAITLGPIVMLAAVGFSASLRLQSAREVLQELPFIGSFLIGLLPIPILSLACALFYMFMPNAKVTWRAAAVGGLAAGVLWHLNNTLSVLFVSQATRNSKIYGPLVPIPVFMVGLYFFWMLLLFGAQVAYTFQNRRSAVAARQSERVNQDGREFVALRVMLEVGRAFIRRAEAPSVASLAERLEVPSDLVSRVTGTLVQTRLLVEVIGRETGLAPALPLESMRVSDVLEAMRRGVGDRLPGRAGETRACAEEEVARISAAEREAGARTIAELVGESGGGGKGCLEPSQPGETRA